MNPIICTPSRRGFLASVGGAGAALALSSCASAAHSAVAAPAASRGEWDTSWVERVRRARHRAVFDAPTRDVVLMLAARYLDNVAAVYGAGPPDVVAVLNIRTRGISLALGDAIWQQYPVAEDVNVTDPTTNAPARRNIDYVPAPGAAPAYAEMAISRLQQRGALVLVCDFALGHLAERLASKVGATGEAVHRELRAGLIPGAVAVPSGIFGVAEAQNAGCGFVPA